MKYILLVLGVFGVFLKAPAHGATLVGDDTDSIGVNFCCPESQVLKLLRVRDEFSRLYLRAECIRQIGTKDSLEGKEISVLDGEGDSKFVKRMVTRLNSQKPVCGRGLWFTKVVLNNTENLNGTNSGDDDYNSYHEQDGSFASLDLSSRLLIHDEEVDAEKYCLASNWETENFDSYYAYDNLESADGGEAVALSCNLCKEEVICYYLSLLYESLAYRTGEIIVQYEQDTLKSNIVRVADKNGDNQVNFDEFKSKIVEYLTIVFNILDRDDDGSIDEVLTNESFKEYSLNIFEELLKNVVPFFDYNEDNAISLEDLKDILYIRDRNRDGKLTISDFIGQSLINLPAPIYTAYTLLDRDQDEKLTMEEILDFVRRTFSIIDENGDCYINLEEVIGALDESNLPSDFQLGLKLLGQHYLTIAKHFINVLIAKADTNEDAKVSLEEIIQFGDFSYLTVSVLPVALNMGTPHYGVLSFLGGFERHNAASQTNALVVWLTALHHFLDNPLYEAASPTKCGLNGQ